MLLLLHILCIRIPCNTELWETQFALAGSHNQFFPSLPCFMARMSSALLILHSEHLKTDFFQFNLFSRWHYIQMSFKLAIWTYARKCLCVSASAGINIKIPICFSGAGSSLMLLTSKIKWWSMMSIYICRSIAHVTYSMEFL